MTLLQQKRRKIPIIVCAGERNKRLCYFPNSKDTENKTFSDLQQPLRLAKQKHIEEDNKTEKIKTIFIVLSLKRLFSAYIFTAPAAYVLTATLYTPINQSINL